MHHLSQQCARWLPGPTQRIILPTPSPSLPYRVQVSETTNDLYNETLFDYVTPQGGLSWSRVITCNALATTAVQWAACFSEYNGGTYR